MRDEDIKKELLVYSRNLEALEYESAAILPAILQHSEVKTAAKFIVHYSADSNSQAEYVHFAGTLLNCPEYSKLHKLLTLAHFKLMDYVELVDGKPKSKLSNLERANKSMLGTLSKAWGVSEDDVAAQLLERKEMHARIVN